MKKSFGFTLTETLIMVAVVSAIAVITFSSMSNLMPNKEAALVRKAYREIVEAVQTLLNDKDLYPNYVAYILEPTLTSSFALESNDDTSGYNDTTSDITEIDSEVSKPTKTHEEVNKPSSEGFKDTKVYISTTEYTKYNKFAINFARLITNNKIEKSGDNNSICSFKTNDGVDWKITDKMESDGKATINVVINEGSTLNCTVKYNGQITQTY
ncbi:hypothetical protein IJG72_02360 [bacterium]|nr:hypothetical protein [bacterium]